MQVYQNSKFSMGTRFNLLLPGIDASRGDLLFSECVEELNRLENLLSCFLHTSEISHLNENAMNHPVEVSEELFEILADCHVFNSRTEGLFDISIGKAIDHWNGKLNIDDLYPDFDCHGSNAIILDEKSMTVSFLSPFIKLNLGGYGKGYAMNNIRKMLKVSGISSAFISFGESSVSVLGKHPHGEFWPVGIQDFYDKEKTIAMFELVDQSVSTSGNLEKRSHIIHPQSGKPIKEEKMISVKSISPLDAEVLSTALMVADERLIDNLLNEFQGIEIVKVEYNNNLGEIQKFHN